MLAVVRRTNIVMQSSASAISSRSYPSINLHPQRPFFDFCSSPPYMRGTAEDVQKRTEQESGRLRPGVLPGTGSGRARRSIAYRAGA
jgi:hypothetical protein